MVVGMLGVLGGLGWFGPAGPVAWLGCNNRAAPPTSTPGRVVIAFQSRGEGEIEPCG